MSNASGKIFVCYRREDSAGHAGRLYDRLNQRFPGRVFMDVASIGLGTRWAKVIEDTLGGCQVAVIMIGRRWLDPQADGTRRIDEPGDPIRTEVSTALRMNLTVVPLLVSGATVPDKDELPKDIAAITEWQALRLDDEDFDHGTTRLIRALAAQVGESAPAESPAEPPSPPRHEEKLKRSGFFGLSLGSFRVWITVGVAAMALIVVQLGGGFGQRPPDSASLPSATPTSAAGGGATASAGGPAGGGCGGPVAAARGGGIGPLAGSSGVTAAKPANPTPPPAVVTVPAPEISLAGLYDLRSYADSRGALSLRGTMQVEQISPGKYRYETELVNTDLNLRFFWVGTVEGRGNTYYIVTTRTNDPDTLVNTPVRSSAEFNGSLLTMVSEYRQRAVWQKR